MGLLKVFVVALSAISAVGAIPMPKDDNAEKDSPYITDAPKSYSGDYTKFPGKETWKDFEELFTIFKPAMLRNSPLADVKKVYKAIRDIAPKEGVPKEVLLSMVMQESHGDVGAPVTYSPENYPTGGLLQCFKCPGYEKEYNLSQDQIDGMVRGGAKHFKGNMRHWGDHSDPSCIYPALREYNSGDVNPDNLSDGRNATDSYVNDIAQRLGGWAD